MDGGTRSSSPNNAPEVKVRKLKLQPYTGNNEPVHLLIKKKKKPDWCVSPKQTQRDCSLATMTTSFSPTRSMALGAAAASPFPSPLPTAVQHRRQCTRTGANMCCCLFSATVHHTAQQHGQGAGVHREYAELHGTL